MRSRDNAEELFNTLGIVLNLTGGRTAFEQMYFELNYTFYLNIIAFALTGFLYYVYRRGLGAPGQYRDPVCGMRTDDSGPTLTHAGETYYFCSKRCKQSFEKHPSEFAHQHPQVSEVGVPRAMSITERHGVILTVVARQSRVLSRPIKTGARMSRQLSGMNGDTGRSRWDG
nr:YHS domain-containing protein [Halobacterium wangiae]